MTGPTSPTGTPRRRIALYSHDTQGLGHIRRNSLIAHTIVTAHEDTDVLLVSGAREATSLPLPPRTEVVVLPGVHKDADHGYRPQHWSGDLAEVVAVRSAIVHAAVTAFAPDVFVVDKAPVGVGGELLTTLAALRRRGGTATVLGLRDVLDVPHVAVAEWVKEASTSIIDRYYDEIWIYGDRSVYDPVTDYSLPASVADKAIFTGYLGHGRRPHGAVPEHPGSPYVLCLVGGGQDGLDLATAFLAARLPDGVRGVLVTGPYLPARTLAAFRERAAARDDLEVHSFVPDVVPLIDGAHAVVTMGGYNSVCEILASGRPALIAPRVAPRAEQLVRAERLRSLGLVDLMTETTAAAVGDWLRSAVARPSTRAAAIDLDGLARIPDLVAALVGRTTRPHHLGATRVPA